MAQANIKAVITAEDKASAALKGFGNNVAGVGKKIANTLKTAAKAASALAVTLTAFVGGMILKGGISRALNIEDAQAKLKGLGHTTKGIEKIMDSALKSVLGTAFGLDAAATAAASAVAAGVEPGKELTKYLTTVGDAATIAGVSFNEMSSIFGKVQTQQRAYTMEINQLADRGIPIYQWLQKELGVTQEALRDMVAAGEVDSDTYFKVIRKNIGGAALESGKTTRGAWENMKAAMSRVGAAIVKDIIPKVREGFGDLTKWFDENSDNIVNSVSNILDNMKKFGEGFIDAARDVVKLGREVARYLEPKLRALWNTLKNDLGPALKELTTELLAPLASMLGKALVAALGAAIDVLNAFAKIISPLIRNLSGLKDVVVALSVSFGVLKVVGVMTALVTGFTGGIKFAAVAVKAFLISLGPVGLAIAGLTAAYAGVNKILRIGQEELDRLIKKQNEAADAAAQSYYNQWRAARDAFDNMNGAITTHLDLQKQLGESQKRVAEAQANLNAVVKQYGKESTQAKDAELALIDARLGLDQATTDQANSMAELVQLTKDAHAANGPLKTATMEQLQLYKDSALNIRDNMKARGEDITKIQEVITNLDNLIKRKDIDIITEVMADQSISALDTIKAKIDKLPTFKTINFMANISSSLQQMINMSRSGLTVKATPGLTTLSSGGNAAGTDFFGGGMSLVGERGPELVSLPRGSKVIPNDKTRKMSGGGDTFNFNVNVGMYAGTEQEKRKIAESLMRAYSDLQRSNPGRMKI